MITFAQYLNETSVSSDQHARVTSMQGEQLVEWIKNNCARFLTKPIVGIYRGSTDSSTGICDTNQMTRKSAYTDNYYTLIIDNAPEWSAFPKRSKSLICTNTSIIARQFSKDNTLSLIIPADNAEIGVCPDADMWSITMKDFNQGLQAINGYFGWLTKRVNPNIDVEKTDNDYNYLKEAWSNISTESMINELSGSGDVSKKFEAFVKASSAKNVFDLYCEIIDPQKNGFKHFTGSSLLIKEISEVWVQGKCAVIHSDVEDAILVNFLNDTYGTNPLTHAWTVF